MSEPGMFMIILFCVLLSVLLSVQWDRGFRRGFAAVNRAMLEWFRDATPAE